MAVPAYATDLTDITTDFTNNWNLITEGGGGQNAITAPETDDFVQGTACVSRNPFSTSIRGIAYDRALITVASGDCVFIWWKADVAQALDTIAGGGVRLVMGATLTDYRQYYVAGNDTYALGGWRCNALDPTNAGSLDRGTPGTPDYDTFGVAFDVPATGPSKGFPFKIDMIRHGREVTVTDGEVANPATWPLLAAHSDATARRWGIVQGTDTGATVQGIVNWGSPTTRCYSRDANQSIVLVDTLGFTPTDFTQIVFQNSSTDLEWTNVSVLSLDTLNRGIITVNSTDNPTVSFLGCQFNDINTTQDGGTNSTWDDSIWRRCNAVTSNGGSFLNCQILESTVAADAGAFVYNETVDPDGELDGMTFTQGTNAHHAIEFGASIPASITLRDMTFTNFDADTTNGAALNFLDTTGTITVTLVGTAQPTFKTAGATIEFVTNPVTVTVNTVTATGTAVGDCRVFLYATSTTGLLPAGDSVTISNSGTTATVTHTAHGLSTNDRVWIDGASLQANNGVFQITVVNANSYTYTMGSAPGDGAVGGTITSTFVFIYGLSNTTTGVISLTKSIPANQSVAGWARKASPGDTPKYRQGPMAGTVSSSADSSFNAVMIPDE